MTVAAVETGPEIGRASCRERVEGAAEGDPANKLGAVQISDGAVDAIAEHRGKDAAATAQLLAVPVAAICPGRRRARGFGCVFSSRSRHTRLQGDWSSDVCSSDLRQEKNANRRQQRARKLADQIADEGCCRRNRA